MQSHNFTDGVWFLGQISSTWMNTSLRSKSLSSINILVIEHPVDIPNLKSSKLGNILPQADGDILPLIREVSVGYGDEDEHPIFILLSETANQVIRKSSLGPCHLIPYSENYSTHLDKVLLYHVHVLGQNSTLRLLMNCGNIQKSLTVQQPGIISLP